MRYALFATPRFGALVLERLLELGLPPVALVTNPDRPVGRRQVLTPPPAKRVLLERAPQVQLLQPERLSEVAGELRELRADCFVVAAYGKILRDDIIGIPPRGVIGVHGSLLPAYRGPAPMQQALLDGADQTGVSLFLVDRGVDHGPVLAEREVPIAPGTTYRSLEEAMARVGADLAAEVLPQWIAGTWEAREQDHTRATFTRKFTTEDGFVPWEDLARASAGDRKTGEEVARRVAGLTPEPGVWTLRGSERIKILEVALEPTFRVTRFQRAARIPQSNLEV